MRRYLAVVFLLLFLPLAQPTERTIVNGITIHSIDVSGLTAQAGALKIEPLIKEILRQEVIIITPDEQRIWITDYKSIGLFIDDDKIIEKALAIGYNKSILKRWRERLIAKTQGYNLLLELSLDRELAMQEIEKLTVEVVKPPQNAQLLIASNNKVSIQKDVPGLGIDYPEMLGQLEVNASLQGPMGVKVSTKVIEAEVTKKDIEDLKVETLLAQFTTWFNPQNKSRTQNVKVAGQALDNHLLAPGGEFSFNQVVGPRTKEAGYNEGPIILNNRLVPGIGGGVCQVSTTLYNALLRANISITERYPHSLVVPYVAKGMDAAVVYGIKDLKFVNNTKGHILVKSYVGASSITVKLFGYKEQDMTVELLSIIEKTIPPKIIVKDKTGLGGQELIEQEGDNGYIVKVERIIRDQQDKVIIHEILTTDYYPPVDRIISVGN